MSLTPALLFAVETTVKTAGDAAPTNATVPLEQLDPPTRAVVVMAILGLILLGIILVVMVMVGGRWVRTLGGGPRTGHTTTEQAMPPKPRPKMPSSTDDDTARIDETFFSAPTDDTVAD